VHKVVDMGLMKEVLMLKVNLAINAKELRNKRVRAATQGPKLSTILFSTSSLWMGRSWDLELINIWYS